MGLGRLFHRDVQYAVTDTDSGATNTFTIVDGLAPDWFGAGGPYRGAMGIPGSWRAANLIADLLGSVPWHAYRERRDRPAEKLVPTPSLLERPAPPDTRVTTFSGLALDYLLDGNAVALIASRNAEGWPTAIVPVPACGVQVRLARRSDPYPAGTRIYQIGDQLYDSDDVVHIPGPKAPGALRGMGVLECHLGSVQLSQAHAAQAGAITDSAVPTGVLKVDDPDLTADEAAELKAGWRQSQATRTIAVLNQSMEFETLAWNPSETQLLEARRFDLMTWALIYGLPASFLGADTNSRTYSNVEQEGLNLLKFSLAGHLARFEQELSRHLPRGTWVKANLDSVLRADTLSRYQAHQIGITAGFLTDDEARELEDKPPLTPAQRTRQALRAPAAPAAPPSAGPDPNVDTKADGR